MTMKGLVRFRCWEEVFSVVPWMGWLGWSPVRDNPSDLGRKKRINELRNGRSNDCKAEMEEKECEDRSFWRSPDS